MFARKHTSRTIFTCTAAALAVFAGAAASSGQCTNTKLTASDAASFDGFGGAIGIDSAGGIPTAVIGAPGDDNAQGTSAGAVYVFTRTGGVWGQMAKFFPNNIAQDDNFGQAVAYADPYLIVGAPGADGGPYLDSGVFYMYERSGASWINKGRYVPQFGSNSAATGYAVAVTTSNGGRALIGAPTMDWDGNSSIPGNQNPQSGAAFLYERLADGTWGYVDTFSDYDAAGTGADQQLGSSVAIDGNFAVIGAPNGHAIGNPTLSGYVKIYRRVNAGAWDPVGPSRMAAPDPKSSGEYGYSVATDGTSIAVGAVNHDSTAAQTPHVGAVVAAGCVYVYRWNASTSTLDMDGQLFADDATSSMRLGGTVKIAGGKVFASSYAEHRVYCFKRLSANNWAQEFVLNDPEPGASSGFAGTFDVNGDAAIVGDAIDTRGALTYAGAGLAFTLAGNADQGNDSCEGAKAVQAGNHSGCTTGATYSGASSCGSSGTPGPDVWYSWTPSCSGNIIIDTMGSDYDTVLSVHSACPQPANAHEMACNDDISGGLTSLVTFNFTAGTTYLIRVGGYNGHAGNYVLRINDYAPAPGNNDCTSPQVVPSHGGVYTWANCKATTDGPTSATACGLHMVNDVWFRFTAPVAGTLKMDTCGSNFDTMIGLFVSGVGCPSSIQEIGCNDDAPAGSPCPQQIRTSYLTHAVLAGQSYMIRVGGYDANNPIGDGVLTVDFDAACPCDWNLSGQVSVQDIFDFLASYFSGQGDFNNSGLTSVQDIFDFLACYFAGCP